MIKKIGLGLLFVLFTGILVVGAINRTSAKTDRLTETAVSSANSNHENRPATDPNSRATERLTETGGNGRGRLTDATLDCPEGDCPPVAGQPVLRQQQLRDLNDSRVTEMRTYQGTIVQAPDYGVDLVLQSEDGLLTIGTGPGYLLEQGVALVVGDELRVDGFWEEGEFKAVTLTRPADDLVVTLRDERGRPYWSSGAQNSRNGGGQGQGRGLES